MSENRKCVNCRHRIIGENCSSKCEIDGHYISYGECFLGWCRHWSRQKDGKEAKFLFLDDLSQPPSETEKSVDAETVKKWLAHTNGKCEFAIHKGTVYNVKDIIEKAKQKEMTENLEKIQQVVYDKCGVSKSFWDNYTADHILTDLYGIRQEIIEADKKERLWSNNIANLHNGNFGSLDKSETYLNYWKAQAEAGYPYAEENVKYFEDMVRKNERE